jgi:hypothetical protein
LSFDDHSGVREGHELGGEALHCRRQRDRETGRREHRHGQENAQEDE